MEVVSPFRKLASIGITESLELRDIERVRLVNIVSLITIGLYVYYIVYGFFISSLVTSAIPGVMLLLTFITLYMNHRRKYALAKSFIFMLTVTSIWFTHQVFVGNPSVLNFFYPVLFCFTFFFKLPEEKKYFSAILVFTVTFIILSVTLPKHLFLKIDQGELVASFTNKIHFIFSILVTVVILVFAFRNKRISDIQIGREVIRTKAANEKLEETQMKLVESDKMASLGMLVSGINHEINNPLNFIKGGVAVLKSELYGKQPESLDIAINAADQGVNQLSVLVKSLNYFSHQTSKNERLDVHELLDNCTNIATFGFKNKGAIKRDFYPKKLTVFGNGGRLQQVFLNLITNAQHAIQGGGEIHIHTSLDSGRAIIKIRDTGVGISHETLGQIFDPFFTTKPPGKGTGLGLSISYRIINDHNGSITAHSELGHETVFTIALPT